MIRKPALVTASLFLAAALGVELIPMNAWATAGKKVDCSKVMSEVQAGKKAKEIAADLSISTSSVYRCKKKAAASASKAPSSITITSKKSGGGAASPGAAPSPPSK